MNEPSRLLWRWARMGALALVLLLLALDARRLLGGERSILGAVLDASGGAGTADQFVRDR